MSRFVVLFILAFATQPALALLEPEDIAILVNIREPEGRALAEFYAQQRKIPDGRIIELDLRPGDEIEFDQYERDVVIPVRRFLRLNGLESQVKCLVTMYGMPLRIAPRSPNDLDRREVLDLRTEILEIQKQIVPVVQQLEVMALQYDPNYTHSESDSLDALGERADKAFLSLAGYLQKVRSDPPVLQTMLDALERLAGPVAVSERFGIVQLRDRRLRSEERRRWTEMARASVEAKAEIEPLREQRFDRESRQKVRELTKTHLGLFGYVRMIEAQIEYLATDLTGAAIDSELSLLWWTYYPRGRWIVNPLYYKTGGLSPATPPPIMVMRLDAPMPDMVTRIITDSIKAESQGLRGKVVLDARGILPQNGAGESDGYGIYDESIRRLDALLKSKTDLQIAFDNRANVFPADSEKDVALYCGWYSLRNYVPACDFVPGAVGYHIASLEMVTIRRPGERGWVRGLLTDGIAGTLGSVAEPFLHSFPAADEFFPLLLTGKYSLAEVYWKTQTSGSWMVSMIGDPLYRPFAVNPALKIEDIPMPLRRVFDPASTQPASRPAIPAR